MRNSALKNATGTPQQNVFTGLLFSAMLQMLEYRDPVLPEFKKMSPG